MCPLPLNVIVFVALAPAISSNDTCSLLIGFKIDAYVCLGNSSDGPHAWVLTRTLKKVKVGE